MLNVSFLVPAIRREFGGCAGNIAYNLKLLGELKKTHSAYALFQEEYGF
jgi:adenosine kinase